MANNPLAMDTSLSSLNSADNDTSATSSAHLDSQQSKWTSASTSLTASPTESRDPSPIRPSANTGRTSRGSASSPAARSRKSSFQNPSPSRTRPNVQTPSTTPRQQLSSTNTPSLPPPSTPTTVLRAPVPQKAALASELSKDAPRWPVSPRLKSPPPNIGRPAGAESSTRNELEISAINARRATPSPSLESASQSASENETEESQLSSGMRTPARGPSNGSSTLETVQEVSQPNTPRPGIDIAIEKLAETAAAQSSLQSKSSWNTVRKAESSQHGTNSESGSDGGNAKTNPRRTSTTATPSLHSRQSSTAIKFGGKGPTSAESSSRNMTVETEQINNLPGISLAPSVRGQGGNGSLRTKPSSETIKPKKDKKKHTRKPASVASGNASSKADIFEAKVASAVEEANSSDSDETFVYDSNPPDIGERPRRYHSRTPSATSMASQVDRSGMRSLGGMMETGPPTIPVKKNMKFVNTYTSSGTDGPLVDDDGRGTSRSNVGSARGTSRHHHPGRWGRNNSSNHTSLFDNESPFPGATKSKFSSNNPRQSSNPPSPRFNTSRGWASSKRQMTLPGTYDMDDTTTGADDERTPLLTGAARSIRSTRSRRNPHSRNLEAQTYQRRPSFLTRFASCLVLTMMLLVVLTGALGFMFATSQPLTDIELVKIGNVLASEQELMMDITVRAHNPNVVVVMIDTADLEIFAKSPHAGTDSEWWRHPSGDEFGTLDDPKNDPPVIRLPGDRDDSDPPPEDSSPNMRLGNIVVFDSPLTYEGSLFQGSISTSTGSLRLSRPGNSTDSGTERWERIISDEFTLIVKGVLKYSLPLSQRIRNVAISGKTVVKPNSANNPSLRPNETEIAIQ
ncbi:vacuolar segregation subunit 7-domain-containing protein [Annulohypoxylon maeteangense]|uniref:vacuolar segregation subunit 7-domain-containing protein n=1 Tax=Annulohypoxylon maeteangense TaxID=1927788 RepID=UPI0020082047|nr:vacuolar segregation subunit 7-domain-containing protein [Annulohypoxylon maeteangense]KAI0881710.1 vacuolar segregation subunit 7-domain-containing protein [Annulohypoxylon maeteangense]